MTDYVPFASAQLPEGHLVYRVAQLQAENDTLRRRVRRYNRGSWLLGLLLLGLWVINLWSALTTSV